MRESQEAVFRAGLLWRACSRHSCNVRGAHQAGAASRSTAIANRLILGFFIYPPFTAQDIQHPDEFIQILLAQSGSEPGRDPLCHFRQGPLRLFSFWGEAYLIGPPVLGMGVA